MGVAIRAEYESAFRALFPQGDYWDAQFSDARSDVSLFCKAKLPEFIRFRERMVALQKESVIETTTELIAEWERVLLGYTTVGLDISQRRVNLTSKREVKLNRAELQKRAALYDLAITNVSFPYRPAFFGHARFGAARFGTPAVFSVLRITVSKKALFASCWALFKPELNQKRFGRMRFGIDRAAYFPIHKRRDIVLSALRKTRFGAARFGIDRLFPLDIHTIKNSVYKKLSIGRFGTAKFGVERIMAFDGGFKKDLAAGIPFYDDMTDDILIKANFKKGFETALVNHVITTRNLFSGFEEAVSAMLLANQTAYYIYRGD